nr:MAG TPA: hypothetical protein [Caudoviricetes sp.]
MKVYSKARHEFVVPVAALDWLPSVRPLVAQSNDAINSLADMVLEFGHEIECKGEKCIYNNDSPVLERAFYVLEYYGCRLLQQVGRKGGRKFAVDAEKERPGRCGQLMRMQPSNTGAEIRLSVKQCGG